jgi:DNA-binding response OmpR family regulator
MSIRVLVVEDDCALAAGLVRGLVQQGFEVELHTTGAEVARAALAGEHDIVVLDLMLPEKGGFAVLEELQHRSGPPVIVLTALTDLEDRLRSFRLGAADYLGKPFWIEELVARIRTRLGLTGAPPAARVLEIGGLTIDLDARRVAVDGVEAPLTRTELDVLAYLAQRPGRAVPRSQLAEHVLPSLEGGDPRTVDAHVTRVRKKLGRAGACIATVWGIGYRLEAVEST